MPAFIDRTGERHGRWVLSSYAGTSRWNCVCDCGTKRFVQTRDLTSGKSTSCGCLRDEQRHRYRKTHGGSSTRAYGIWLHMRDRCNNPNNLRYALYGGRGITICERWNSFANFYADMGEPPEGRSLDRINNDGNYEPSNCRWATQREQVHNSRSTKLSDADATAIRSDPRPLKVIAAEYGVGHTYICSIRNGKYRNPI
jgi:hypothetical protein